MTPTLVATANGSRRIDLAWSDPSDLEVGFRVQRADTSKGPFDLVTTVAGDVTAYADHEVAPDTAYYYRIVPYDLASAHEPSLATDRTEVLPSPTGVAAASIDSETIEVAWTSTSFDHTGFRV